MQREHRQGGDRCPYSRSFTAAFTEDPACPAYQRAVFTVTDTAHRRLGPALTCRHLAVGASASPGRFYPRCGLGDETSRMEWVAAMTPASVDVMRSLEEEFEELMMGADRTRLVEAKARLLAAGDDSAALVDDLELMLGGFLDRVDDFIGERAGRLRDVGLEPDGLHQLLHDWSLAWLRSRSLFAPGIVDMRLLAFSREAAALLGAEVPPAATARALEVVARAGGLLIERSLDPVELHLSGAIDSTNAEELAAAVAAQVSGSPEIVVDFSRVLFCDLSGLRVLVRAAAQLDPDRRILLRGVPANLRHAARLVGWADLPGLVIGGGHSHQT